MFTRSENEARYLQRQRQYKTQWDEGRKRNENITQEMLKANEQHVPKTYVCLCINVWAIANELAWIAWTGGIHEWY